MRIEWLSGKARRAAGLLAGTAVLAGFCGAAGAQTVVPAGPTASGVDQNNELRSIACTSAGNCVAVGGYSDPSNHAQVWIETESGGSWSSGTVSLAGLDGSASYASLAAVACPAAGACVAVGSYLDSSSTEQGLILTQSGSTWSAAKVPTSGLDAYTNPALQLVSLSCAAVGSCVAVGSFDNAHGQVGLILTDTGGSWSARAVSVNLPGVAAEPQSALRAASCPSSGECVAVGHLQDSAGNEQGLIETERAGTWSASEVDASRLSAASNPRVDLSTVACPTAGNCSALGTYRDGAPAPGSFRPLTVSSSGHVWQPAGSVSLPGDAQPDSGSGKTAQSDLAASGISCVSAGNCTAVGSYDQGAAGHEHPLALVQANGAWSPGTSVGLPADAATDPAGELTSIVCHTATDCVAAGTYDTSGGVSTALVAADASGTWTEAASAVAGNSNEQYSGGFSAGHIACAPDGYCAVAGLVAANQLMGYPVSAFVLNAPAAPAAVSATDAYTQATVSWAASPDSGGTPLAGYRITANDLTNSAHGGQSATAAAGATSATLSGLTPGDSYTFTVAATSMLGAGLSTTSSTVTALASATQLAHSLTSLVRPSISGGVRALRRHGIKLTYAALEPGTVSVSWYALTARRHHHELKRIRTLIASATHAAGSAQTVPLEVRLNAAGRRLTRRHRRLEIMIVTSFRPTAGPPSSLTRTVSLPWA